MKLTLTLSVALVLLTNCSTPEKGYVTISAIGYDPYARDCDGGISIDVTETSLTEYKGSAPFIKPTEEQFRMPEGLVASGDNKLTFYGYFQIDSCEHRFTEELENLIFYYDSVIVECPYKFFNTEKMEFDSINCERHPTFNERIRIVE
jgi:hypothetical protein